MSRPWTTPPPPPPSGLGAWVFAPVKIGGGGSVNGLDIHYNPGFASGTYTPANASSTGAMICFSDTYGIWIGSTTLGTVWTPAINSNNMTALRSTPSFPGCVGFVGANFLIRGIGTGFSGCPTAAIAPSEPLVMYARLFGYVIRSLDGGVTWADTGCPQDQPDGRTGQGGGNRNGQGIAIDPRDANIVLVGGVNNAMYRTTNGKAGSPTWSASTGIPLGAAGWRTCGICFNPADNSSTAHTNSVYAASPSNGVYYSSDNGQTFTKVTITGMPLTIEHAALIPATGAYLCSGSTSWIAGYGGGLVLQYIPSSSPGSATGTWSSFTPGSTAAWHTFAVNQRYDANKMVVADYNSAEMSVTDSGVTTGWSGLLTQNPIGVPTGQPTWLSHIGGEQPGQPNQTMFDPTHNGRVWMAHGTGIIYTDSLIPNSGWTSTTYQVQTAGIEQMVCTGAIAPPNGGPALVGVLDQLALNFDQHNAAYSANKIYFGTFSGTGDVPSGIGVDYARVIDPADHTSTIASQVCVISSFDSILTHTGYHSKSTNANTSTPTWALFSPQPNQGGSIGATEYGGRIIARSTLNFCTSGTVSNIPQYTLDGGATWNTSARGAWYCDANAFYAVASTGVYSSPTGATWTQVSTTNLLTDGTATPIMKTAPSPAPTGNLFLAQTWSGSPKIAGNNSSVPSNNGLQRSTDSGATWSTVPLVASCEAYGFGAAELTYPTFYFLGFMKLAASVAISYVNAWPQTGVTITVDVASDTALLVPPGATSSIPVGSLLYCQALDNGWWMEGYVTGYNSATRTLTVTLTMYDVGDGFQSRPAFQVSLWGVYRSNDNLNTWQCIGDGFPAGNMDQIVEMVGDGLNPNKVFMSLEGATMLMGYRVGAL